MANRRTFVDFLAPGFASTAPRRRPEEPAFATRVDKEIKGADVDGADGTGRQFSLRRSPRAADGSKRADGTDGMNGSDAGRGILDRRIRQS